MLEGTESGTLLRKSINELYGATFGKAAKYLNTLVEDPQKAAKAIMQLRNQVSSIGRAIGGFARGVGDVLRVLRPVVEFIGKLTGGMSEGEVTATRWIGRIFAVVTVLNLLNAGIGLAVGALGTFAPALLVVGGAVTVAAGVLAGLVALFGDTEAMGRSLSALMQGQWRLAWEEWSNAIVFKQEAMITLFDGLYSAWTRFSNAWNNFIVRDEWSGYFDWLWGSYTGQTMPENIPIDMSRSRSNANGGSSNTNTTMHQTNNINMPAGSSPEEVAEAVSRRTAQSLERLALAAGHSPRFTT